MSAFKLVVKTDNTGTSNNDQFTLPLSGSHSYNFTIDWGDGSTPEVVTVNTSPTHTFSDGAGVYEISIVENVEGGFPAVRFSNTGDKLKVTELSQFGTNKFTTLAETFHGCANMEITATDGATANTSSVTSLNNMFRGCTAITHLKYFDTSSVTSASAAFYGCNGIVTFDTLDLSSCANFASAFGYLTNLEYFEMYDFRSATNMSYIFVGTTISTRVYSKILENSYRKNPNSSVAIHATTCKYYPGAKQFRDVLTDTRSWSITDGGQDSAEDISMSDYLDYINEWRQGIGPLIKRMQPSTKHITLFNDSGTWKVKDHTFLFPIFTELTEQGYYVPPFKVTGINLDDDTETERIINYDKFHNTVTFKDISETLLTCEEHDISVSKIYLDSSDTNATLIHIYG